SQVKAVVADSPYTSAYDLFAYQMKRMFSLPAFPLLDGTSIVTNVRADYSLKEASAIDQVRHAEVPILYIHGEADTFVPTAYSEQLFAETKSEKRLLTLERANHGEGFIIAEEHYKDYLEGFL